MNIRCPFRTWPYSCIWLCNNITKMSALYRWYVNDTFVILLVFEIFQHEHAAKVNFEFLHVPIYIYIYISLKVLEFREKSFIISRQSKRIFKQVILDNIFHRIQSQDTLYRSHWENISVQSAGNVEYTDWISAEEQDSHQRVSWIWHKTIWWWGLSKAGALGNVEYSFIDNALRSTLARSGSTW